MTFHLAPFAIIEGPVTDPANGPYRRVDGRRKIAGAV
jgi:hypothetical protein